MALLLGFTLFAAPPADLLSQAHRALDAGKYDRAVELAFKLTDLAPEETYGYILLGLARLRQERYDDARRAFERAVEIAPTSASLWFNLGTAAFENRSFSEAEKAYLRAAQLDGKIAPMALLDAGFAASGAGHMEAAERHLREALKRAPADQREVQRKADVLLSAIEERRTEAEDAHMHRLLHEGKQALDSGRLEVAKQSFKAALKLARRSSSGEEIESDLEELLDTEVEAEEVKRKRVSVEAGVGVGYDSNVPQSGFIPTELGATDTQRGAALFAADLQVGWRFAGDLKRRGLLTYTFSQVAYASELLDPFSLQEHELRLGGSFTVHPRVTLEAEVNGFALFSGIKTFAPFLGGVGLGPTMTFREPHDFETKIAYEHLFKWSMARDYVYLDGQRDDLNVTEAWTRDDVRLSGGYAFHREEIGVEQVPLSLVTAQDLSGTFGPNAIYNIPYSYLGHEATVGGSFDLPASLHLVTTFHYEHRDYQGVSFIDTGTQQAYKRKRVDDRYTLEVAFDRELPKSLDLQLEYTMIANTSNIDNTDKLTSIDYDNKNYFKHTVELSLTYSY